jgi:hypothetical protein
MNKNDLKAIELLEQLKDKKLPRHGEVRPNYSARYAAAYLGISRKIFARLVAMLRIEYDVDRYSKILSEEANYHGPAAGRYSFALVESIRQKIMVCQDYERTDIKK